MLQGRIASLERIFQTQADKAAQHDNPTPPPVPRTDPRDALGRRDMTPAVGNPEQPDGTPKEGEWHDHTGLRISNGQGTVSVYQVAPSPNTRNSTPSLTSDRGP